MNISNINNFVIIILFCFMLYYISLRNDYEENILYIPFN